MTRRRQAPGARPPAAAAAPTTTRRPKPTPAAAARLWQLPPATPPAATANRATTSKQLGGSLQRFRQLPSCRCSCWHESPERWRHEQFLLALPRREPTQAGPDPVDLPPKIGGSPNSCRSYPQDSWGRVDSCTTGQWRRPQSPEDPGLLLLQVLQPAE